MKEIDYSIESEDEFYEDFSGYHISDKDLEEILILARKNSDVKLRRSIKELQYLRFLMKHLVELIPDENEKNKFLTIQNLAKNYVNALIREQNKSKEL